MSLLDELSPDYVGAASIKLTPADLSTPRAFSPVDVTVAIDPAATDALRIGLVPPLELTVTSPSPSGFYRHVYRRNVPSTVTFTPKEGGEHLVRLREVGHNKWHGELVVSVAGERVDPRAR